MSTAPLLARAADIAGSRPLNVLAYTRGRDVPSARFRVQQYREVLRRSNVHVTEAPARMSAYPPARHFLRVPWGAGILTERTYDALRSWKFDVTLFQRELIPTLLTVERLTRRPRLLDVDDAIWLPAGPRFARRIAALADRIVCGNNYLAEAFSRWNRNVVVIPTAVDTRRFAPDLTQRQEGLIGWTGRSSGLPYLYDIEPALDEVMRRHPHTRLRVISNRAPQFRRLPTDRVEYVPWSRDVEVRALQQLHVGLMPLRDTEWERGKCSYKMLLYAACGVPAVVSPVGMNAELLGSGSIAASANGMASWVEAISTLLTSEAAAAPFRAAARRLVVERFNADSWGERLGQELRLAAG